MCSSDLGTAKGHVALSNDPRLPGVSSLRLDAVDLDLAALPLREMAGVSVAGKLRVKADLPALLPVETAQGALTLVLDGAALTGGTVMGFSLPPTTLGRIDGSVAVEKGIARVDKTAARGGDLEADVDGNVNLRPLLSLSQADLHIRFRPADHWLNENSAIKGMMGLIQNARQGDGRDKYVFGETQLYLGEYEPEPGKFREVDPQDDAAMAYADALFTVQQLQRWAQRHDIDWDVQLGRARGRVRASGADSAARSLLSDLSRKSGLSADEAEIQRPRLDEKYRDRR